jgi:hypothetical protein
MSLTEQSQGGYYCLMCVVGLLLAAWELGKRHLKRR